MNALGLNSSGRFNMHTPFYTIRTDRDVDANQLLDIDLKCFESSWLAEEWARLRQDSEYAIIVAMYFGTPIGFAVICQNRDRFQVAKLAVKEHHRRQGVSMMLLAKIMEIAHLRHAGSLALIMPEGMIYGDAGKWAKAIGFQATKPILKRHFTLAYGETEDGVKFIAPVRHP